MPGPHIYNDRYGAAGVFNFALHGILGTPCALQWGYPVTSRLIGEIRNPSSWPGNYVSAITTASPRRP